MMIKTCSENLSSLNQDPSIRRNATKTLWVVVLTSSMMIIEIVAGYLTGSMALLADGWHMASHAGALLVSLLAYQLANSHRVSKRLTFGAGKIIPLGGYTSSIGLGLIAVLMIFESIKRLLHPTDIQFNEAIAVAVAGLLVNVISALILNDESHHHHAHEHADDDHHEKHEHHVHDHNLRSAYFHVLADALTSVLAIIALTLGKLFNASWLDPAMGVVGALVILRWAYHLCHDTGLELLDVHSKMVDSAELIRHIESSAKVQVDDIHAWRIAPKALACEISLSTDQLRGAEYYKQLIRHKFFIQHLIIEERLLQS